MISKIKAAICGKDLGDICSSELIDYIVFEDEEELIGYISKEKNVDSIITIGIENNFSVLYNSSFEVRKKWVNFEDFDMEAIENAVFSTTIFNCNRKNENKLFSIFTCAHNTTKEQFERLYNSLKSQTYQNWNWWILDDSSEGYKAPWKEVNDAKITVLKNETNHGIIGFNKHVIAMACDGDYLVEVDHDDELTTDCLEHLNNAFQKFPDAKFAYSNTLELVGEHTSVLYGDDFSCGQGFYRIENVNGWNYKVAITCPSINARSVRSIHALPNHVRAWEKEFYHSIGGHCKELSVCDDMDILIRTFLNTRMIHIDKVLYLQYEYNRSRENTQGKRFELIQALNSMLKDKYDIEIHQRILDLGFEDTAWNEEKQTSEIYTENNFRIIDYGYQYLLDITDPGKSYTFFQGRNKRVDK